MSTKVAIKQSQSELQRIGHAWLHPNDFCICVYRDAVAFHVNFIYNFILYCIFILFVKRHRDKFTRLSLPFYCRPTISVVDISFIFILHHNILVIILIFQQTNTIALVLAEAFQMKFSIIKVCWSLQYYLDHQALITVKITPKSFC